MKKTLLCAAALLLLFSAPSRADDTPVKHRFSGFFMGLNIGYNFGTVDHSYDDGTTGNGDISQSDDFSGAEGGVFFGYRHQAPSGFNLGIEGGFMLSMASGAYLQTLGGTNYSFDYEKSYEWNLSLKPGYLINENLLGYGIAGVHVASYDTDMLVNGVLLDKGSDSFRGYHLGAGMEYMFSDKMSARAEYRYNILNDNHYGANNNQSISIGGNENVIRLGVAYNLGKN